MVTHIAAGVLIAVAVVLGVIGLVGQGTPSAPTGQLSGTLNAGLGQNYQMTFTSQIDAGPFASPFHMLSGNFVYSIVQPDGKGGVINIAQAQNAAYTVVGQSGLTYTIQATVSFATTAICSGTGCGAVTMNLTIAAQAVATTFWGTLSSPISHFVFSTNSLYQVVPHASAAPAPYFAAEFGVPILAGIALGFIGGALIGPKELLAVTAIAVIGILAIGVVAATMPTLTYSLVTTGWLTFRPG